MSVRKLSVYVLTYNEEENIRDCLESVKWADEVVVVDCYSTDRTVEICREYTDKIFQREFVGFGDQRNFAVSKCTYDWVLSLDADERVTPELREEIINTLGEGPAADAYFVPRKTHFLKTWIRHGGWYPDYRQTQLFNRNKLRYRDQLVHEGFELDGKAGTLRGHVLHFPFLSVDQFIRKIDRYAALRAEDMARENKRFHLHQVITHPAAMFFRMYVLKLGFLDRGHGLVLALLYGYYTMLKYVRLWEAQMR